MLIAPGRDYLKPQFEAMVFRRSGVCDQITMELSVQLLANSMDFGNNRIVPGGWGFHGGTSMSSKGVTISGKV